PLSPIRDASMLMGVGSHPPEHGQSGRSPAPEESWHFLFQTYQLSTAISFVWDHVSLPPH
ncbi:hypothetical protein STEG23_020686, partial [Scotinomys teguina]